MLRPWISFFKASLRFLSLRLWSETGDVSFLSCRLSAWLVPIFVALVFCLALPASGQIRIVWTGVQHDVSPSLSDLVETASGPAPEEREAEELRFIPLPPGFKPAEEPDKVLPRTTAAVSPHLAPTLGVN